MIKKIASFLLISWWSTTRLLAQSRSELESGVEEFKETIFSVIDILLIIVLGVGAVMVVIAFTQDEPQRAKQRLIYFIIGLAFYLIVWKTLIQGW